MVELIRNLFHKMRTVGEYVGTHRTHDSAFAFRMLTGFPGTVTRSHPASIEPCLIDGANPPLAYGTPLLIDAASQGVRPFGAGDAAVTKAYGFGVRPYPIQQQSGGMSATFGDATPPTNQPMSVLKSGYITSRLNYANVNQAAKNAPVYVWIAASALPDHVQGGLEAAASVGNTIELEDAVFNGAAGPDGVCEVIFNA